MAHKKTHDVVATVGKYKDQSGAEKKRYLTVGAAFTDEQGRINIKLEAAPVGPEWSGWLSLYPVAKRQEPRQQSQSRAAAQDDDGDDIPF